MKNIIGMLLVVLCTVVFSGPANKRIQVSEADGIITLKTPVKRIKVRGMMSVKWETIDGTAVAGEDYVYAIGEEHYILSPEINPDVVQGAAVKIIDDGISENSEYFIIRYTISFDTRDKQKEKIFDVRVIIDNID